MKLAAMQPYFLPYLGYFDLIDSVDLFIIFDTPRFQKKTWMTRNRVLHPDQNQEFKYIHLRTEQDNLSASCNEVTLPMIKRSLFIEQNLQIYQKMRALNYNEICEGNFILTPQSNIQFSKFILQQIQYISNMIGIDTEIVLLSETDYLHNDEVAPGMHAFQICKHFGADSYINAPGGKGIFNINYYKNNGININFIKPLIRGYKQGRRDIFIPNLSILDVLMFNEISHLRERFIAYELE